MPISRVDLQDICAALRDLYRVLDNPTPQNPIAERLLNWGVNRTTPAGQVQLTADIAPAALIRAAMGHVLHHLMPSGVRFGGHCDDITKSELNLDQRAALLDLRDDLSSTFADHRLACDAGLNLRFRVELEKVLRLLDDTPSESGTGGGNPSAFSSSSVEQDEGAKPPAGASNGAPVDSAKQPIRRPGAERLVAAAIEKRRPDQHHNVTVRQLNEETGVSIGMIPTLTSWRDLQAEKAGSVRSVPLTDAIQAVLPNPSADAADPAEAAADAEVLDELLGLATSDAARTRYEEMPPGERWQMLDLLKDQAVCSRRDQRRPRRERPDCS